MEDLKRKAGLPGTKYSRPGMNPWLVTRQRLYNKLDAALSCRLTSVVAPAGYGKTTAVLDWLEKRDLPAAWLSLDSFDNNPAVFWRNVCSALESVSAGVGRDTEYVFSSPELLKSNIHINILIDRLSGIRPDFALVLDDLHLISDPDILGGLSYLIDYLPEKMHLILISRTETGLNMPKQRIKWQARQLEGDDLLFNNEEIFRFYQARGFTLESDELERIENYSEGWAAALVAVAMSMERGKEGYDAVAALAWSSRDIGQYLRDEVIRSWRPEKLAFAMKTSILETLTEELCDAVTGEKNASRIIDGLLAENGFLTAVDEEKRQYRYHYLFKTFLYKLLAETDHAEIPNLHIRAAHWLHDNGRTTEAVEHLLNGGAYQEAFEIFEHQTDPLVHRKDFATLLSWIDRLPEEYKNNSFQVAVIYAFYYAETGRYDLSRKWLDRMKALRDNYPYATGPEWYSYSRTVCILSEANILVREGDIEYLRLIVSAAESNTNGIYKMPEYNDFNSSDIYYYRCPISKAVRLFRESPQKYETMAENYRGMISRNPGYAPLGAGEFLYETNRLDEAVPFLLKAVEEARNVGCPGALVPAMVDLARIKRALGDLSGAFSILEECEKDLQKRGNSHWIYLIRAFHCRLFIDIGNAAGVQEWFASSRLNIFSEITRVREFELIICARVLFLQNRTQDARLLLQRLLAFTGDNMRPHSRVEVLNLLAMLAFSDNHTRLALRCLDESLGIGLNEGYVRSYLDELAPMAQILRAYIKSRGKPSEDHILKERKVFAAGLLGQMHGSLIKTAETRDEVAGEITEKIGERFTAQEKKVMELIVSAATNQEISDKLGISLRTVKAHTGSIYAKLGIKNRVQCIKVVRELELL